MSGTKSFNISKQLVMDAYKVVKANAGAAGIDEQLIEDFEKNLKDNLYKLWNRMSSGSYFPSCVKAVEIPKKSGGKRTLGIPTVADRIAQTVVKMTLEPTLENIFLPDSYGYRPNKSAHDAIEVTRQRCWKNDWVLEYDIKGMFDNINHDLLMEAVRKHTGCKWVLLYIERWLKVGMIDVKGNLIERTKGTPQGGVISPLLANLFMHYAFDLWMEREHPNLLWCRYADDGLIHCRTEEEAEALKLQLDKRLKECNLEMHPDKTRIIYCKDSKRKRDYPTTKFDFLGYTFRARGAMNQYEQCLFTGFLPAISSEAQKRIRQTTRKWNLRRRTDLELEDISKRYNPVLRGLMNYYGKHRPSEMESVFAHFNRTLRDWSMQKYKELRGRKTEATKFITTIAKNSPQLFVHWEKGMLGI